MSAVKKWCLRLFLVALGLIGVTGVSATYLWSYYNPAIERTNGVVYSQRNGQELTLDILKPSNPNGLGVAFMVSGGWKSQKAGAAPAFLMAPLLQRGYTIFAVCHISQPDSTVPEIVQDMHRAIRFIRFNAKTYGVDPERLGVTGGSAGGHLSLMLATRGGAGEEMAQDPVDKESSSVQAVAIFYPVTDLLNLGESTENPGDGGPPKSFVKAFGDEAKEMEKWKVIGRECSPIYFVDEKLPPTLIYHGDADTLVPLDQSERFKKVADEKGKVVELEVHPGGAHGWASMILDIEKFADWFDKHLRDQTRSTR